METNVVQTEPMFTISLSRIKLGSPSEGPFELVFINNKVIHRCPFRKVYGPHWRKQALRIVASIPISLHQENWFVVTHWFNSRRILTHRKSFLFSDFVSFSGLIVNTWSTSIHNLTLAKNAMAMVGVPSNPTLTIILSLMVCGRLSEFWPTD